MKHIAGILVLASGLAAPAAAALKNPDTVVFAHLGEVTTLDPVYPYDSVTQGMLMNVYETLIRFNRSSLREFQPELAEKVPSIQNGLIAKDRVTYRFPLRQGVKFHNGDVMTPEDARYSLLRFMLTDPEGGPASLLLEPVFGVAAARGPDGRLVIGREEFDRAVTADPDAVVVRLKKPFAPFLSIMARWSYVMDKKWCVARGEWDGTYEDLGRVAGRAKESSGLYAAENGTGPFYVEKWDNAARLLTLAAFKGYRGAPPHIRKVVMKTAPDFALRRAMLESGTADIIDLPRPFLSQLAGLPGVKIEQNLPRLATDPVLFFTLAIAPEENPYIGSGRLDGAGIPPDFFASPDVRKGFSYAFDYAAYRRNNFKGGAARARGSIPPGLTGYDKDSPAYDYNRTLAEEHLRRAFDGRVWAKGFRFTLTYNNGADEARLACETLKKGVEDLNPLFRVELRAIDYQTYADNALKHRVPMFARGWSGDYPDPHNFVFPFFHSKGRFPKAQGYSNPVMDKLIESAGSMANSPERQDLYAKILRLANSEAIGIYTVHPSGLYAMRDNLRGFYDNAVFMGIYFYPLSKQ